MFDHKRDHWGRRAGLAAVVTLLALCLVLLGGGCPAVEGGPSPQRPVFDPLDAATRNIMALEAGPRSTPGLQQTINPGFTVDLTYDAIWGLVDPGDKVIVNRTADGAYGAAEADGVGFFWTYLWHSTGQPADIGGGDTLELYVNGSLVATLMPMEITGGVGVLADQVTGNVSGLGAGTVVTVTLGEGYMFADEPYATGAADGSGSYLADFSGLVDIGPYMMAQVQYRDGGHTMLSYVYPEEVFQVNSWNNVLGYAAPGAAVTVTCYESYPGTVRWSAATTAGEPHGTYAVSASDAGGSIEYGDVVEVDLGGGVVISVTADYLDIRPDAAGDQITGIAPAGETLRGYLWDTLDGYNEDTDVADGGGNYALDLGLDLETQHWPYVGYADGDGDEVRVSAPPAHIMAYPPWNGVWAVADAPEQPVTYTLDTGTQTYTQYGWCGVVNTCDRVSFDAVESGYVITAELPSLVMAMTVADWSLNSDTSGDQVYGDVDTPGWLLIYPYQWHEPLYPAHGWAVAGAAVSPPSYAVSFPGFDIRDGMDLIWGALYDMDGHRTFNWRRWDRITHFEVDSPHSLRGVPPNAGEVVTATLYTADGVELASTSDDWDDDPWRFALDFLSYEVDIKPGNWLTVTSESGWEAGLSIPTLTVRADADTDLIWGQGPKAQLMVEHDWDGYREGRWVPVDGYVLDRAYFGGDIETGDRINVQYLSPSGNRMRSKLLWPWMFVNYGEDEAGGVYDVGHTFWITVTDSGGTPRATATSNTQWTGGGPDGNWQSGFTVAGAGWSPAEPDIQPGDWVHFRSDDGYANSVRVGTIAGGIHSAADTVSGAIVVPWLALQTLNVGVGGWGFPGFEEDTVALDAAGRGAYFVDFSPTDLPPDISLGVWYEEPDEDRVYNNVDAIWEVYLPLLLRRYTP